MDLLKPLRVFLEREPDKRHFDQADDIMLRSERAVCFTFVMPRLGRYTVPALCGYGDVAMWIGSDVVVDFDVSKLWRQIKTKELCAVYVPEAEVGKPFPSMMLFRNKYCERLTPEFVFSALPEQLNPVVWAGGPQNIGTIEVSYAWV